MRNYHQLQPSEFQRLVQAIVARRHPAERIYPLNRADGGVDGHFRDSATDASVALQVKHFSSPDPRPTAVLKAVRDEAPKIEQVFARGYQRYLLSLGCSPSANPETGLIDKVDDLVARFDGRVSVLWLDDLEIELDNAPELLHRHPRLMTGEESMNLLADILDRRQKERVSRVFRKYLEVQHEAGARLSFHQLELEADVLDLVVDPPIDLVTNIRQEDRQPSHPDVLRTQRSLGQASGRTALPVICASGPAIAGLSRMVLEGGPGQGKSTMTQAACHGLRMRLLHGGSKPIPESIEHAPVRLPIRLELKTYSAARVDAGGSLTFEDFIVSAIADASQETFTKDDLASLFAASPFLICLDGLDESGDVDLRAATVNEIERFAGRLATFKQDHRLVVTTRPAPFRNSPQVNPERFDYFTLLGLPPKDVDEYAMKWCKAKKIPDAEAAPLQARLKELVAESHLSELSKNPLQLTILLHLLRSHEEALPNRRTLIYQEYVKIFFDREANKSEVVRDNRSFLERLHEVIGFVLHARAERGRLPSLSGASVQALIESLVAAEEFETDFDSAELFSATAERVVMLASRTQDRFEIENQALREYFAARFLYNSATMDGPGDHSPKIQRFSNLTSNSFWDNVVRFYAGSFAWGELFELAYKIVELASDIEQSDHAHTLISQLLSDRAFEERPKPRRTIAEALVSQLPARFSGFFQASEEPIAFPDDQSRGIVTNAALAATLECGQSDRHRQLAAIARANSEPDTRATWWRTNRSELGEEAAAHLAAELGLGPHLTREEWQEVPTRWSPLVPFLSGDPTEITDDALKALDTAVDDLDIATPPFTAPDSPLAVLAQFINDRIAIGESARLTDTHRLSAMREPLDALVKRLEQADAPAGSALAAFFGNPVPSRIGDHMPRLTPKERVELQAAPIETVGDALARHRMICRYRHSRYSSVFLGIELAAARFESFDQLCFTYATLSSSPLAMRGAMDAGLVTVATLMVADALWIAEAKSKDPGPKELDAFKHYIQASADWPRSRLVGSTRSEAAAVLARDGRLTRMACLDIIAEEYERSQSVPRALPGLFTPEVIGRIRREPLRFPAWITGMGAGVGRPEISVARTALEEKWLPFDPGTLLSQAE